MKITFIHIPRTSGRSMNIALKHMGHPQDSKHYKAHKYPDADVMFTVVRNPYNRLVSLWKNYKLKVSFEDFVKNITAYWLYNPQVEWVDDRLIILEFEDLQSDWKLFCKTNGLDWVPLPHVGKTEEIPDPYTPELIKIVNDVYHDDFVKFNYEKL